MMKYCKGKLKPYHQIVQSNALIMAEHKMNLNELLAFKMVVSAIDTSNNNPNFREVSLKKADVLRFIFPSLEKTKANNISGGYYKKCKDYFMRLTEVEVVIKDKKKYIYTAPCSHVEWKKNESLVKISFSEDIAPYIFNLQKNFTKYEVGRLKYMKSKYAVRLYEYFNMMVHYTAYTWTISLSEFRRMLGVQNKYKEFKELRKGVLDLAIKELQSTFMLNGLETRKTNFNIEYKSIKGGCEVIAIEFSVKNRVKNRVKNSVKNSVKDSVTDRVKKTAKRIRKKFNNIFKYDILKRKKK
ncbi:hypothetical protein AZF37_09850 (plasmid) [endosymbiont 'TC1' of Trimyema compressum]|nr:hypothetical protein AZF37_09850 [endosymbiont 'TC1' of Trimyema compressum]